ncbi:MAG: beta-galactosidase [Lachnospiraceae bacterium]|nr:beta-galactosidase [Lachnospiraceae bacterium]
MKLQRDSQITYDPKSIIVDGHRWFPVMGEMHYSRVPANTWGDELRKMKAGGVDIISAYTIWIHHEEICNEFDFTGDRCLRDFMKEVKDSGMYMFLRFGPWAHGEARNGGFPDWLLEKSREEEFELRANNERYLGYVRCFWEQIYHQVEGFFLKDGGPIIGIQVENEYGHVGGFTGEKGEEHMRTLKALAQDIGFDVPIWTATGWGGAVTGGMLPVMGGYCDAPWDPSTKKLEPSVNYVFTQERNDHNIASDYGLGEGITFDMEKVPYLTCELGGGLQPTAHRRPVATGKDTEGMTIAKMGSGVSLIGYYMYHGGTNPDGKVTTLQESKATGYPNDLPVKNYDFNAPIRESGQLTDSYRRIRRLALFLKDFGEDLAGMDYIPQPGNPEDPKDLTSIRSALRYNGKSGYFFVNNYQRLYPMAEHTGVDLVAVDREGKSLCDFEECDMKDGDHFFYPIHLSLGEDFVLKKAKATPLTILRGEEGRKTYVFYGDADSFVFEGEMPQDVEILVLSSQEALFAGKFTRDGQDYLVVSEGDVVDNETGEPQLVWKVDPMDPYSRQPQFRIYPQPPVDRVPKEFQLIREGSPLEGAGQFCMADSDVMAEYRYERELTVTGSAKFSLLEEQEQKAIYSVTVEGLDASKTRPEEVYLMLDYSGERACCCRNGQRIRDDFYTGQTWEIGLKRYTDHDGKRDETFEARMEIDALTVDMPGEQIYLEMLPEFTEGKAARIDGVRLVEQYRLSI